MKRRNFLKTAGAAASAPLFIQGLPIQAMANSKFLNAMAMAPATDRVLVMIQLQGGNDGLNTIIPIDMYTHLSTPNTQGGRSDILIPETETLKFERGGIDIYPDARFNPAMLAAQDLFKEEKFMVMQGVGYQNQNFSHFRSIDIWMSGSDPHVFEQTGWLGRKLEADYPSYATTLPDEPVALTIGSGDSLTYMGSDFNYGVSVSNPESDEHIIGNNDTAPGTLYGYELDYIRDVVEQTNAFSSSVKTAYQNGMNAVAYPNSGLANQLRVVARLLSGGIQTKFFLVNIGGFDTHGNQLPGHANILRQLSEAIKAFQDDLASLTVGGAALEERVVGMTFSEFGRTIKSNTTQGTDHGTSAPLMLFGEPINSIIMGDSPTVYDSVNAEMASDLNVQFDFRSIYASVLHEWFEMDVSDINSFFGKTFEDGSNPGQDFYDGGFHCNIPILKTSTATPLVSSVSEVKKARFGQNFPNPAYESTTIPVLSNGENISISLYDMNGKMVQSVMNDYMPAGKHDIRLKTDHLPKGMYTYRVNGVSKNETYQMLIR